MAHDVIACEAEADSLEEARRQAEAQIPRGSVILSEEVLSTGDGDAANFMASTEDQARAAAEAWVPPEAIDVDVKATRQPGRVEREIEATDESEARRLAESELGKSVVVESVELTSTGKKGLLGVGRTKNGYLVTGSQKAVMRVSYRMKARVSITATADPTGAAISLIRAGEIARGRDLLRRSCRVRPDDIDTWAVAAYEFALRPDDSGDEQRANEEAQKYYSGLADLTPDSCEYNSIATLHNHLSDPEEALAAFDRASRAEPNSEYGATLLMFADIVHSEVQFAILSTPVGGNLNDRIITYRLKGSVQLLMRDHAAALESFRAGAEEAEAMVDMMLEHNGGMDLSQTDRRRLAAGIRRDCRYGEGLVMMDRGDVTDAREVFGAADAEYSSAVGTAG